MAVHVDLHLCVAHVPAPLAARSPAQSCSVRNVRKYVKKQIRPIRWRPKRLFLAVFGCFWAVLGCSGLFWAVSRCFCCFRCCIAVVRLSPVVHGGFGLLGAVFGRFRPFPASRRAENSEIRVDGIFWGRKPVVLYAHVQRRLESMVVCLSPRGTSCRGTPRESASLS